MSLASKQRLLLGIAVLLMFVPTFLYGAGMLGRAPIFEGDVRKEMTCITCDGLGRSGKEESCQTCRGRGVADFIIPGPNRPIQLVGTVTDAGSKKVEGADVAVREAEGGPAEVLLKTNQDGQFGVKLPPGDYVLKVTTPSQGSLQENLSIAENKAPLPARSLETLHILEKDFSLGSAGK